MKLAVFTFLFCVGFLHSHAAEKPLIPAALKAILPNIHGGMTVQEVETVLTSSYPAAKMEGLTWSGQTGVYDYKLDEQFTLSICFTTEQYALSIGLATRDAKTVVHGDPGFGLYNNATKRRVDIKSNFYESPAQKKTKFSNRSK